MHKFLFVLFITLTSSMKFVWADIRTPITFDEKNMPLISMNINGHEIDRISIDTGASNSFYFPKTIFDLIIPDFNKREAVVQNSIDVFGHKSSTVMSKGIDIKINGEIFKDMNIEILKPWGEGMMDENGEYIINGVLGLGIMNGNKILVVDYISNALIITSDLNKILGGYDWYSLNYIKTKQGVMVDVISDSNEKYRMVIDTGASHSVIFTGTEKGCVNVSTSCPKKIITTPDSTNINALLFQVKDSRIDFDGLLGHDYLSNRILVITDEQILISLPKNNK
ncbi:hypothetical protein ACK2MR_13390 [Providencia hangzhouensis]|uniref:hypothetical protein n=1 Tax=Providencia hangzhouensis TaxID=3031799 RepID=UPI0024AAC0DC